MRLPSRVTPWLVVGSVLTASVVAGCRGGDDPAPSPQPATNRPAATVAEPSVQPGTGSALRARLKDATAPIAVRSEPAGSIAATLPATTPLGSRRTFLVDRVEGDWVRVLLPTRPNGSTGWVAADAVTTERITDAIVVDLSRRTITVTVSGHDPLTAPVAVGTQQNPTPTGRFYVTDRVRPRNPHGAYGAFALGLSAHSDTLTEFGGRDGQVGIHGTNQPASIGKAASHGCVRVPPEVVKRLELVPLGTPVVIT